MIDPRRPDYGDTPVSARRPRFAYQPLDPAAPPCVTIVTPFHNTRAVFHETARSVFQQSLQEWEWLIVNNGSTDAEALAVLAEYRRRDARIRILDRSTNDGPGTARNAGFEAARGVYVFQLDSDDLLEPTALEKCLWFLASYPEYGFVKGFTVGFDRQTYLWNKGFHHKREFCHANLAGVTALVRRDVWARAGGYDETIRGGLEDWDFWLRCAARGFWGATLPEYLDWYRRRDDHAAAWPDWDGSARQRAFQERLREKYPRLYAGEFPRIRPHPWEPGAPLREHGPCENILTKNKPRVLLIVPWLALGGADKFNLDLTQQLARRGWEITIATTQRGDHGWLPDFARLTPDVFSLHHFLRPADHPMFLRYLIRSRRPDAVLISNSVPGYAFLPYLRAHCPEPVYADYCHSEQEDWNNGGYPRFSIENRERLDLTITASRHLRDWMIARGGDGARIEVAYINVDADQWLPRPEIRARWRKRQGLRETCPVILYAARLSAEKQPRVLGRVMLELKRRGLEFAALVAGDGPERHGLEEFIRRNQLRDRMRLLGNLPLQEMPGFLGAGEVFFLPSQREGISLGLYEAMAAGLAVVAADVGGQRELVTPECGLLLARGTEEEEVRRYADALQTLLTNPRQRAEMGQSGQARVRAHFVLDQMGDRMAELLEQAARRKRTVPSLRILPAEGDEAARRAIARLHADHGADLLWNVRRSAATVGGVQNGGMTPLDDDLQKQLLAQAELEHIQNSRTWRFLRRLRQAPPFRWLRSFGFGSDKNALDTTPDDPHARLTALKASHAYRLIQALKRTPPYQWYARRKYGSDFQMMLGGADTAAEPPAGHETPPNANGAA